MTHNADNEDMKLLGDTYEILVFSQAVQTTNFPDAATALNAAFGPEYPWQNGAAGLPVLRLPGSSDYIKGADAAELLEIIEQDHGAEMTGHFCHTTHAFNEDDLKALDGADQD